MHIHTKQPQASLAGGQSRHRPILPVHVLAPGGSWILDGLLDTGADDTIFPLWVSAMLGLDLAQSAIQDITLAGRGPIRCHFFSIQMRITDGVQETFEWDATVGFAPIPLRYPLLGMAGCLQFFDTEFRGADLEVQLAPNRLFVGRRY